MRETQRLALLFGIGVLAVRGISVHILLLGAAALAVIGAAAEYRARRKARR